MKKFFFKSLSSAFILIAAVLFSAVFLADIAAAENGQTVFLSKIEARADKHTIYIGDIIEYTVDINIPKQAQLKLSAAQDKQIGEFEIRDFEEKKIALNSDDQAKLIKRSYSLTIYQTGKFSIPAYTAEYRLDDNADWQKLASKPIEITVESVLEQGTPDLTARPIKPKVVIWRDFWGWVLALLIIAIVVVLIWLAKKYLKHKKQKQEVIIPAHMIALEELGELKKQGLIGKGKIKEYFEKLSACIRHYLENRFALRAPSMSTEEFLAHAKTSPVLSTEQKHMLHDFLSLSDMVKFAKYDSSQKEAEDSFVIIRNFVEQTKLEPEKPEQNTQKKKR